MQQQTMKIWVRRVIIALVFALALSALLEYLQISSQPVEYRLTEGSTLNEIEISPAACAMANCSYDAETGILMPTAEDPQVILPLPGIVRLDGVALFFSEPTAADCPVQIFYAVPDTDFTEQASLRDTIPAGSLEAEFRLPETEYSMLRIDLDAALPLERFALGEKVGIREYVSDSFHPRRAALLAVLFFGLFLALLAIPKNGKPARSAAAFFRGLPARKRSVFIGACIFVAVAILSFLLLRFLVLPWYGYANGNRAQLLFCIAASMFAALLVTFRKSVGKKPEVFFVVLSLLSGTLLAFYLPTSSYVSWDDEHHYIRALNVSYLDQIRYTSQDERLISYPPDQSFTLEGEAREDYLSRQNRLYDAGASVVVPSGVSLADLWEVPAAIGLYLGRVLRLPYFWMYCLGRWFSLLAYTVTGFFAIRRLKSGKMILAAVLLIPTNLFLASNYSYDPGVTGLCALGFSYWFAEWHEADRRLKPVNAAVMVVALTLGCMAKAIYFPLLLLPLFLPREKFADRRARGVYSAAVLLCMVSLVLSFVVPYTSAPLEGDSRGGSDVNAAEQIRLAIADPLRYASVLGHFLLGYLNPASFGQLLTYYAYLGVAGNMEIYLILLAIVAFTDRSEQDDRLADAKGIRILGQLILLAAVALAASSMYAAFTPVGADTINGFQPRYLIPVIFPAMMMLGTGTARLKMNRDRYTIAVFALIAFVNYSAIMTNCIGRYY